ncbi:ATP-dependent DNA helicase RecG [Candidatus Parcubacteria bacterium]|nr:ATP-dependent DNA helicase RecG [Patescibacteria group bacterium]MBU4309770.1 ATP-dependent DNA helicase RecG [Patescibacteria group bacterium]MBU4431776.1 ATP-dependent DNA helicase RecG [Patescibacteria group bacterium]MBU4578109.1 ATP-dependent DNA helicase RecG [Patescibacteria group bacterium]MCG2696646.1 ATP-dependent DNA helicase RecG [Candidatus Parcubacteria bacterium]
MLTLDTKIENLSKVGATTAKRLKNIGLETIQDLLFYFPFRYDDFSEVVTIKDLQPNTVVNIVGEIDLIQNKKSLRTKMNITEALVNDGTDTIKVIWFNQPFIAKTLHNGDRVSLSGKVDGDLNNLTLKSPSYEKINTQQTTNTQGLVPNYHLTANITQKQIRYLIKQALPAVYLVPEWIPINIIKRNNFISIDDALKNLHFPKTEKMLADAKRRLSFDELFLTQLQSQLLKKEITFNNAPVIEFKEGETKEFVKSLPFELTDAQKKSAWQILMDMQKDKPMSRLLEGDVGSGKTITAVVAMFNVALNKYQSLIMVPTEILAGQHYNSICKTLSNSKLRIALFTRTEKKINTVLGKLSKNKLLEIIKNGEADIIIGTHALIQEDFKCHNLGLAIIDEQHRFGVEQRKKLLAKANNNAPSPGQESTCAVPGIKVGVRLSPQAQSLSPHLLSMTATPIPRSLALVLYGELDISIINELPKNRKKIITSLVSEQNRTDAYKFIYKQVNDGRQVFVVCPLIDPSDKMGVKSVTEEFKKLNEVIFPDLEIALLHGKLKSEEKEQIMQDFVANKTKILVSTSVIEVGVDVPNATIMMIEGADRFGLAQLHQFRGRVGRGAHQSYCFLFSDSDSPKTKERLQAMEKHHDGFTLAKIDLKQRGPGEVYGTNQKGFPEFKIANLFDHELIEIAQNEAAKLIDENPELKDLPDLKEKIEDWKNKIHLE